MLLKNRNAINHVYMKSGSRITMMPIPVWRTALRAFLCGLNLTRRVGELPKESRINIIIDKFFLKKL